MEKLRKVLTQTTWANASDAINKNSDRIYEAITRVENATTKNKGYFETSNALLDTYPNPSVGDIAFVFNSANTIDTPYDVYKAAFSSTTNKYEWYDSGINASFADVDINSVNDSIRDIDQQVGTLKDPRLPIICDTNGRIGLNVGNGLYVDSNGDLCATQSIGGGSGSGSGGESYYAAAGISINEDNFISVKIGASLDFDNDNALKVGTGEGLVHNSNGKLSVNVGKGLVIDDKTNAIEIEEYDAIKEIPIAIQKKQDRLIEGSGIEITSENVINVDGSNLQVLLSTNAINDEDGKRIKTTYTKKEEVDGIYGAIEATNTTVASHTTSIENLTNNKQDKLEFGNGLSTVGNLVKVEDAVLKDVVDNKKNIDTLSSSISGKQDKLTPSDGINLDEGKLSVHIGTGLEFDPLSSAVVVKVGAGVTTDINQSLAIKHDTTLTTDAEGQLGVNQGTITNIAASEVAKVVANAPANYDTLKEIADYIATDAEGAAQLSNRIGAVESALPNKMDTIGFGSGLAFSSNVVKVDDAVMTDISSNKNNITKLQSSVDGLSISKQDTISDLATIRSNAANGATAYGWGYHGTAGYAKKAKVNGSTYESDSNGVINLPSYPTSLPANGGNADMTNGYHLSCFGHYQDSRVVVDTTNSTWYIKVKLNVVWNTNSHHLYFKPLYNNIAGQLELELPTFDDAAGYIIKTSHYNRCNISGIRYIDDGQNTVVYLRLAGYTEASCVIYSTCEIISASVVSDPNIRFIDVKSPAIQTNYSIHATEFYGTSSTATSLFHLSSDDATLKIYPIAGLNAGVYGNEAVAVQTAFDGTDPTSTDYTIIYPERTVLSLQPRGGRVGIGTTTPRYELDVNGPIGATTYFFKNNPNIYLDSTTENALVFYDGGGRRKVLHAGNLSTYFTNGFENVNGTIKISTSYIAQNIKGDGLIVNDSGLSVDSGVCLNQITKNIAFPSSTDLIKDGFLDSNYPNNGYPTDWFLKAICKWAIKKYKRNGNILLIGVASPNISGTCMLSMYSSHGVNDDGTPRYCSGQFEDLSGNLITFGFYDYNWLYDSLVKSSNIPTSLPANGGNADTAKRLVNGDNRNVIYESDSSFYVGDNLYTTKTTDILGNSVRLRYGTNASFGFLLNAAGRVTIGESDLAERDYKYPKLYVDGEIVARGDMGNTIENKTLIQHNCPLEVGRTTNTMSVAIGVTDDDYGIIQSKGYTITSQGKLAINPQGGDVYIGGSTETGFSPRVTILNSGNVGINTTDPKYKLDVNGDIRASNIIDFTYSMSSKAHHLFVRDDDDANWVVTDKNWQKEYNLLHSGNLSTYFTNGFEQVGDTIKISTSYIAESLKGDGLVLDESGKMSVDSTNLSVKNADTLDGHDSSYFASKTELGNKQDTLVFGSGIAHSNNIIWVDGSQLNVNYANSAGSVAWGNVSGRPSFGNGFDSTNSVVQLKLSTGLAIDDRGYLYVTGL